MVEAIFAKRNIPFTELNRRQAEVPVNCTVIKNYQGTAPGMWFERKGKYFMSMPGVPYEMKALMSEQVLPLIKQRFQLPAIYHFTVLTQGLGESFLAETIEEWENGLADHQIKLAYLPSPGQVRLRLSVMGDTLETIKRTVGKEVEKLKKIIPQYIYGYETYGEESAGLEKIVGRLLLNRKQTLAVAESCTGGYLSHLITSVSGSSAYYNGSVIPYHNQFKHQWLEVSNDVFQTDGAVSEICVIQMADGIREKFQSDYALATSGIAGPSGGTEDKPVGTVWIALSGPSGTKAEKFIFGNNRERNIHLAAITALNMLRKELEIN